MAGFRIVTKIAAPIELCFNLARDIDFHTRSLAHTEERAVAGRTTGLIGLNESVRWEARHFGIRQRLTTLITELNYPHHFRDVMTSGAFHAFAHYHRFRIQQGVTLMIDEVVFQSLPSLPGRLVDALFMTRHLPHPRNP